MRNSPGRRTLCISILLVIVAACEQPTAPEVVKHIDSIERNIASGSPWANPVWRGKLAGGLVPAELFLRSGDTTGLQVSYNGTTAVFNAFVLERVVIRQDQGDGYPCPLVNMTLIGLQGDAMAVYLRGSNFDAPIGAAGACQVGPGSFTPTTWHPHVVLIRPTGARLDGVAGTAEIEVAGSDSTACDFLKEHQDVGAKVDCAVTQYFVAADVRMAGKQTLLIPRQRLAGVRLTVHCNSDSMLGGCEPMLTEHR
jgi:hypothetical protein